ncbi:MAG: complex I subunit 1 family protein [Candidatus Thorarchaeota archaeon]
MINEILLALGIASFFPMVVGVSLIFDGVDRKLHARMQNRVGPPLLQPFYDIIKLFGKEQLVPETSAKSIFVTAPLVAVACPIVSSVMTVVIATLHIRVEGDIVLMIYLLTMPALMFAVAGASSGNPYGAIGFSRAILLIISYELAMIMSLLLAVLKTGTALASYAVIEAQYSLGNALALSYPSMFVAALVFLSCIPAAMSVVPFDTPVAKTEIAHGTLIEYTGSNLAFMKLAKSVLCFNLTFLATVVFFNQPILFSWFPGALSLIPRMGVALLLMVITVTLPRTVLARSKPHQVLDFYWKISTPLVFLAAILVVMNL